MTIAERLRQEGEIRGEIKGKMEGEIRGEMKMWQMLLAKGLSLPEDMREMAMQKLSELDIRLQHIAA